VLTRRAADGVGLALLVALTLAVTLVLLLSLTLPRAHA
jgi:hypothetical protein